MTLSDRGSQARSDRRAARIAASRADILDAAEFVFGSKGINDGSVREIAQRSGFSPAAIYTYFESKHELIVASCRRRATEMIDFVASAADSAEGPLAQLHLIIDATVEFYERFPYFRQLLRQLGAGAEFVGPALDSTQEHHEEFRRAMSLFRSIVERGQIEGEIRQGNPVALVRLYMVLLNEHVHLLAEGASVAQSLTATQFHSLVDGALCPTSEKS